MIFNPHESPEEAELEEKCAGVAKYWGDKMPMMLIEEMAELTQAISKYQRAQDKSISDCLEAYTNMLKEMGDVYISLEAYFWYLSRQDADITEDMNGAVIEHILTKLDKKY